MNQMMDKQNRIVTLTSNTLRKVGSVTDLDTKTKSDVFDSVSHNYVSVLVPYTPQELAKRKPGNTATSHLVTMKRDNLTKLH